MWSKLGDTELVVQFQQFCGLQWREETNDPNGHSNAPTPPEIPNNEEFLTRKKSTEFVYNPVVHALFHISSSLGDEQVLIALLSFMFWNFDPKAVVRLHLSLATSLYIGQAAKDIVMAPRPPSPPVIRVEKKYAAEFSTPSTHAMVGVVVPFALVYFTYEKLMYKVDLALSVATIYCCLVAASRVYLGMHYVKDVLYGILLECLIIILVLPILKKMPVEKLCQTTPNVVFICILTPIFLLYLYPTPNPMSFNTYSDVALVLGAAVGALIGLRFSASNEALMLSFAINVERMSNVKRALYYTSRFALGTTLLALTRITSKWLVTTSLSKALPSYRIAKPLGYKRFVEVPHKLITYSLVSFNAVYLAPKLFQLCSIS